MNDTYGHVAGDAVLKDFTGIIKRYVRNKDRISRYGGEEFLIFLPDSGSEAGKAVSARIRKSLEKSATKIDGNEIKVTSSFGVASLSSDNVKTAKDLIKHATKIFTMRKNPAETWFVTFRFPSKRNRVIYIKSTHFIDIIYLKK